MNNINRIIYSVIKEVNDNSNRRIEGKSIVIPSEMDYKITKEEFGRIILKIDNEGLIRIKYTKAKGIPSVIWFEDAELTFEGEKYLKDNSALSKTYRGIKEAASWISMFV